MPVTLAILMSHLLAATACSPAQWLAPRAQGDQLGTPWTGSDLPRECVPCRFEATFPGKTEPWQTHRWTFDGDGLLTRIVTRIGDRVSGTSCEQVAAREVRCVDEGVTSRITLENGRMVRHQRMDWDERYERDSAGRVT